jgi:hypothetical protein
MKKSPNGWIRVIDRLSDAYKRGFPDYVPIQVINRDRIANVRLHLTADENHYSVYAYVSDAEEGFMLGIISQQIPYEFLGDFFDEDKDSIYIDEYY